MINNLEVNTEVFSIDRSGAQVGNLPVIIASIANYSNKKIKALVDTRAASSLCSEKLVSDKLMNEPDKKMDVTSANNAEVQCSKITKTLFFDIEGDSNILLDHKIWVMKPFTKKYDIMFGKDFITKYLPIKIDSDPLFLSSRNEFDIKIPIHNSHDPSKFATAKRSEDTPKCTCNISEKCQED